MVSLWGSKNGDDQNQSGTATPGETEQGDSSSYSRPRQQREADERTRLIPPHGGYLDPDDPAVSVFRVHFYARSTSYTI